MQSQQLYPHLEDFGPWSVRGDFRKHRLVFDSYVLAEICTSLESSGVAGKYGDAGQDTLETRQAFS